MGERLKFGRFFVSMNVATVIAAHHLEISKHLKITIESYYRWNVLPILVFDKLSPEVVEFIKILKKEKIDLPPVATVSWVTSGGIGVGHARDVGLRHAVELGFDCIINSDSHVVMMRDPRPACASAFESGFSFIPHLTSPFDKFPQPSNAPQFYSVIHTLDLNQYADVYWCKFKPCGYDPVIVFSANALKKLMDAQSDKLIIGRGFGAELHDITMSLTRLGFYGACNPSVLYIHRVSTGEEEFWRKRWNQQQLDLFMESMGVYLLKHVPEPYRSRSKYSPGLKRVQPWQKELINQFNKVAVKSALDAYKEFVNSNPIIYPRMQLF